MHTPKGRSAKGSSRPERAASSSIRWIQGPWANLTCIVNDNMSQWALQVFGNPRYHHYIPGRTL
eukprot:4049998-Heterocapsa_arctica.AAC.1